MIDINILGILAVAVVSLILGAFWYSPILFGNRWLALMGKGEGDLGEMKRGSYAMYLISFIGSILTAFVLDLVIQYRAADSFFEGAILGILVWLGFVVPMSLGAVLFEKRPKGLYFISMGYYLVILFLGGGILAAF